jgi:hypothetical protein
MTSAGEDARTTAGHHPSDEDLSLGTPGQETGATLRLMYPTHFAKSAKKRG